MLDRSTLFCRCDVHFASLRAGECFFLDCAAKVLLYFDIKFLVEGQYAIIHTPFVLHGGKVYFLGSNRAEFDKKQQNVYFHLLVSKKKCNFVGECDIQLWHKRRNMMFCSEQSALNERVNYVGLRVVMEIEGI